MAINLASKYENKVAERFYRESQIAPATNNEYKFTGVKSVTIYSFRTVELQNYSRSGLFRYGSPEELQDVTQTLTITQDKSFTFTIDRGNKVQRLMLEDAGKALSRQIREVIVPYMDKYVFDKMRTGAGTTGTANATTANAYKLLLEAQEAMGNAYVPDEGRVCFCSYHYANLLKQDTTFIKDSDTAQKKLIKGEIGTVDGCRIVRVPSTRLPDKCNFILIHPSVVVFPRQLTDYKIHDNPPGINGWLVEGRLIFDAFVLNNGDASDPSNKSKGIYYQGNAS